MPQLNDQDVRDLIAKIAPLNNQYRDLISAGAKGAEIIEAMWEVGDLLERTVSEKDVKPHTLYWRLYGKAEGARESNITRDFLSYCLRICRYFKEKGEIRRQFGGLRKYSSFREAFPLLENPKYRLESSNAEAILKLLNSDKEPSEIKERLVEMKSKRIGTRNPRTQRLKETQPIVEDFVSIYNDVFRLVRKGSAKEIESLTKGVPDQFFATAAELVGALVQENLYIPELEIPDSVPGDWRRFFTALQQMFERTVEDRNRVRRVISVKKIFTLSELLNALRSQQGLAMYRQNMGWKD